MNWLKKLFSKKKPTIYTTIEARKTYKEEDPHPLDNPIFNQWARDDPDFDCGKNPNSFGGNDSEEGLRSDDRLTGSDD